MLLVSQVTLEQLKLETDAHRSIPVPISISRLAFFLQPAIDCTVLLERRSGGAKLKMTNQNGGQLLATLASARVDKV